MGNFCHRAFLTFEKASVTKKLYYNFYDDK